MNAVCHDVLYVNNREIMEFVEELVRNDYMLSSYQGDRNPYLSLSKSVNRYLIALQQSEITSLIFKKDDEVVIKRIPLKYRKKGDFLIVRNVKEDQLETETDDSTRTEGPSTYVGQNLSC